MLTHFGAASRPHRFEPRPFQATSPVPKGHRACKIPGAGNGTRTRECQLGKLMPYHLAMPAYVCAERTSARFNIPRNVAWDKTEARGAEPRGSSRRPSEETDIQARPSESMRGSRCTASLSKRRIASSERNSSRRSSVFHVNRRGRDVVPSIRYISETTSLRCWI